MTGRTKWSDIKGQITPERRECIAVKTAELRSMLPPTTYAQVCWAAQAYNTGEHRYNEFYRAVYSADFRSVLLERGSEADAKRLLTFLNQWKSRRPYRMAHKLAAALPKIACHLAPLSDVGIESGELGDATFDSAKLAFDGLMSMSGVGPTTASKILGVLNPSLFVMWDSDIQQKYFNWQKRDGQTYSIFLKEMQNSARSIMADAHQQGIEEPAVVISESIRQDPPFTLAKFINDYVWLTVTRQEKYPGY